MSASQANVFALADYDTTERVAANSDLLAATKAAGKATVKAMTFEVANVAQIALENGFGRDDLLVIAAEKETGGALLSGIDPAGPESEATDVSSWWGEDLAVFKAADLHEQLSIVTDGDDGRYEVQIGAALGAEAKLLGDGWATKPSIFTERRGNARQELNDQRDKAARAGSHLTMIEILEQFPNAKAARFAFDDDEDGGGLVLVEILDADRIALTGHDVDAFVEAYDLPHLSDYTDIGALNFSEDDLIDSGVARSDFGAGVVVHFDAVRRLRGVAEAPNQPSLFEYDSPADYGWTGRAA